MTVDVEFYFIGTPVVLGFVLAALVVYIAYRLVKFVTSIPWGGG